MKDKMITFAHWCIDQVTFAAWADEPWAPFTITAEGVTVDAVFDDDAKGTEVIVNLAGEKPETFDYRFRLLDDDGILYAYGWSDDSESESAFDPLDWAEHMWGCTIIEYLTPDGEWEML